MPKDKRGNKRSFTRLIALVLCVLLVGSAVVSALISLAYAQEAGPETRLSLTMEEQLGGVRAEQVTRYVNDTGRRLENVMFSLCAGALRRSETAPFEDFEAAYPDGFEAGGVQIVGVMVDGEQADWGVQGQDESFVRVACGLDPGEAAEITFSYEVLLPGAAGFLGTGEMGWRLSFFYPAPCVFDREAGRFELLEIGAVGERLYFEPQDFAVRVDAPENYLIASGGAQRSEPGEAGRTVTTIELEDARDFALAISRRYTKTTRETQSGVQISAYTNTKTGARRALDAAQRAVELYGVQFGGCPVARLTIAQADLERDVEVHAGLILVDKALFSAGNAARLEKRLAFAVAKMWFGLAVGVNPEAEPWLTDGLCTYLSLLYYEMAYGRDRFLRELNEEVRAALAMTIPGGYTPDARRSLFSSREDYDRIVVRRGAAVFHELRGIVGEEEFYAALGLFYRSNAGRMAGRAEFTQAVNEASGRALGRALEDLTQTIDDYANQALEWYE